MEFKRLVWRQLAARRARATLPVHHDRALMNFCFELVYVALAATINGQRRASRQMCFAGPTRSPSGTSVEFVTVSRKADRRPAAQHIAPPPTQWALGAVHAPGAGPTRHESDGAGRPSCRVRYAATGGSLGPKAYRRCSVAV